jgi:hypothetical protein
MVYSKMIDESIKKTCLLSLGYIFWTLIMGDVHQVAFFRVAMEFLDHAK